MLNVTTRMHHGYITDATARILGLIGLHKLVAALHTLSPLRRAHHLRESSSMQGSSTHPGGVRSPR